MTSEVSAGVLAGSGVGSGWGSGPLDVAGFGGVVFGSAGGLAIRGGFLLGGDGLADGNSTGGQVRQVVIPAVAGVAVELKVSAFGGGAVYEAALEQFIQSGLQRPFVDAELGGHEGGGVVVVTAPFFVAQVDQAAFGDFQINRIFLGGMGGGGVVHLGAALSSLGVERQHSDVDHVCQQVAQGVHAQVVTQDGDALEFTGSSRSGVNDIQQRLLHVDPELFGLLGADVNGFGATPALNFTAGEHGVKMGAGVLVGLRARQVALGGDHRAEVFERSETHTAQDPR